jgi:hypothetical protein
MEFCWPFCDVGTNDQEPRMVYLSCSHEQMQPVFEQFGVRTWLRGDIPFAFRTLPPNFHPSLVLPVAKDPNSSALSAVMNDRRKGRARRTRSAVEDQSRRDSALRRQRGKELFVRHWVGALHRDSECRIRNAFNPDYLPLTHERCGVCYSNIPNC